MEKIENLLEADDKILWSGRANDEAINRKHKQGGLLLLGIEIFVLLILTFLVVFPYISQEARFYYDYSPSFQLMVNTLFIIGIIGLPILMFFTYRFYKSQDGKVYDLIYAISRKNFYITAPEIRKLTYRLYKNDYYFILGQYLKDCYFEKGVLIKEGNVIYIPQEKVTEIFIHIGSYTDEVGLISSVDGKPFWAFSYEFLDNTNELKKVIEEYFSFELSGPREYHCETYKRKK